MARRPGLTSLEGLPDDYMLKINDVASVLNEDYTTAYERIVSGGMPFHRTGARSIRVTAGDLRAYIESTKVAQTPSRRFRKAS